MVPFKEKTKDKKPNSLPFVFVKAHYSGGTFVRPYIKTSPDRFLFNNLSYARGKQHGF